MLIYLNRYLYYLSTFIIKNIINYKYKILIILDIYKYKYKILNTC